MLRASQLVKDKERLVIKLEQIQHIYFIGIGGIGMSALARYFHARGAKVSGYDRTETPLTKQLAALGMDITYTDTEEGIPTDVQLVVYTPAVPATHKGLEFYRANGFTVIKRSDVLQIITEGAYNICIAGTHGKTTITTMTGHLLRDTGFGCNAFLGGISVNYQTNFWSDPRNVCVVEADEYDRSFLKLHPDIAVISAMDADHLDIYGTPEALEEAFIQFANQRKPGGWLISKAGLKKHDLLPIENHITYGVEKDADVKAHNIRMSDGTYTFDVEMKNPQSRVIQNIRLNMGGMHNVENATVAVAVSLLLGIEEEKIKASVASFKGVKRRFEYKVHTPEQVLIDDYAHHPEELQALISSAKALFPERKCTVIFQPHLFSRTRDFADGFAETLMMADETILLPIYPARELPMEGVSSSMLAEKMEVQRVTLLEKTELMPWIEKYKQQQGQPRMLIMAGAGDIDALVEPVREMLNVE